MQRQTSNVSAFYSVYESAETQPSARSPPASLRELYSFRPRIPSFVDVKTHAASNWWSDAHHDCVSITKDMGAQVKIVSRVLHVKTEDIHTHNPANLLDFFVEYLPYMKGKTYVIYRMILGDLQLVSLAEVVDLDTFRKVFACSTHELSHKRLKLITCPVNLPVNLPLKGPRSAEAVAEYFGPEAASVSVHWDEDGVTYACISIDIYSKWIIRKILPNVALTVGRICDFIVVDYEGRAVVCGLRIICTPVAIDKFKCNRPA